MANLVDGDYPADPGDLPDLKARREAMVRDALDEPARRALDDATPVARRGRPPGRRPARRRAQVYSGTIHHGSGAFRGTGPDGGRPRVIRVLKRGEVREPGAVVGPGTVPIVEGVPARFDLPPDAPEGERRAALARWLTDDRAPAHLAVDRQPRLAVPLRPGAGRLAQRLRPDGPDAVAPRAARLARGRVPRRRPVAQGPASADRDERDVPAIVGVDEAKAAVDGDNVVPLADEPADGWRPRRSATRS